MVCVIMCVYEGEASKKGEGGGKEEGGNPLAFHLLKDTSGSIPVWRIPPSSMPLAWGGARLPSSGRTRWLTLSYVCISVCLGLKGRENEKKGNEAGLSVDSIQFHAHMDLPRPRQRCRACERPPAHPLHDGGQDFPLCLGEAGKGDDGAAQGQGLEGGG